MKETLAKERKEKAQEVLTEVKIVNAFKNAARYNEEDRLFAVADVDGNSMIDFDEFCNLTANEGVSEHKLKELFDKFDVDHSGMLDLQEFAAYLRHTGAIAPDSKW
jgi:Ca2+-binding EF-hand superfamily protein